MTLVDHFESFLGLITSGWSKDADGNRVPFQVVTFEAGPIEGTRTFATLGLSHRRLALGAAGRTFRQELVMLAREEFGRRNLPGLLQQVGLQAIASGRGYLKGEVLGPRGQLFEGTALEAFYVAIPVYFPDGFHVFEPPTGDPIIVAWLVPITAREAQFVRDRGDEAFEDELLKHDPDLLDFQRASIV
jgi:hypothetical protein